MNFFKFEVELLMPGQNRKLTMTSDKNYYSHAFNEVLQTVISQEGIKELSHIRIKLLESKTKIFADLDENFGCCTHWKICQMGKYCVFEEMFPSYASLCSAYKRFNKGPITLSKKSEEFYYFDSEGQMTML